MTIVDYTSPIFDNWYSYKCIVPFGATISDDELVTNGIRMSGLPELDNVAQNRLIPVYWTINQMVEAFRNFYPITIANPDDTYHVYEAIVTYLDHWKKYITSFSLNSVKAPMEDLALLDEFAALLRPRSKESGLLATPVVRLTNVLGVVLGDNTNDTVADDHVDTVQDLFKNYQDRFI